VESQKQRWDSFEQALTEQMQEIRQEIETRLLVAVEDNDKKVN
jgi:hypothetical protein